MKTIHCLKCGSEQPHQHMHDQAHGLPGTHMDGSERFVCSVCKKTTHSSSDGAKLYPFILDKP